MATTTPDLERRKQVRLRLRPDLEITPQFYEGVIYHVVKDPVSLRYYRFSEADHFLLRQLDGRHTMEETRVAFELHFRPQQLLLEDLESLGQMLVKAGLAVHELPQAGRQLFERRRRRRRTEWLQRLTNVLYIELPLLDPDPLLRALLARLRWLFTPPSLAAGVLFMLAALLFVGTHFEAFWAKLPSSQEFFRFQNLLYLWLALGLVKIIHELAHGLTCAALGGEVHDMGVLLLCLSPCLYMNVSDAWKLPEKGKRMAVGLAGVYVELLIAAAAVFLWWNTSLPLVHNLALSLMIVCSVNTVLFNGNPLLRYDGYYVLADWLEVPNLRERCNAYLKRLAMKHCLGMEVQPEPPMAWQRRLLFVVYAVASYVYGWVVAFGILWSVSQFLKPYKLGSISLLMAFAALASMIGWPLGRTIYVIYRRGKLPAVAAKPTAVTAAVLVTFLVFAFVVPLPISRVRQTGLVQPRPEAALKVFVTLPGSLERLHVRDGQSVQTGDILAEFRNLELEGQLEEARTQHAMRLVQLKALRQQAAERAEAAERARIELAIAQADGERKLYAQQVAVQEKTLRRLVLRAPRAGIVMGAPRPEEVGKLWEKDLPNPFCTIGDPTRLRALVPLTPADYRLLKEDLGPGRDLAVTLRIQGWAGRTWRGRVAGLPESEALEVPEALTTRCGGPLVVKPGTRPGTFVPQSQHYLVSIDLLDAGRDQVWPGTLGQVKVHCRWRTAAWWLWRTISSAFDLGLV